MTLQCKLEEKYQIADQRKRILGHKVLVNGEPILNENVAISQLLPNCTEGTIQLLEPQSEFTLPSERYIHGFIPLSIYTNTEANVT